MQEILADNYDSNNYKDPKKNIKKIKKKINKYEKQI